MVTHPTTTARCDEREQRTWADSGMRALTGPATSAGLGPPRGFLGKLAELEGRIAAACEPVGHRVDLDGLGVLTARAAVAGLQRRGSTSCGGSTRLVRAVGGWFALSLARDDDRELVPAWLGADVPAADPTVWQSIRELCGDRDVGELVERGVMLGIPVAELGSTRATDRPAVLSEPESEQPRDLAAGRTSRTRRVRVADLSALWAGPLCGRIFAAAGADVVKIESTARPDGARRGPAAFFELLDRGKDHLLVDLSTDAGIGELRTVLEEADVVIESSRPRALEQAGIHAGTLVAGGNGPSVWISITGHGREGANGQRVAFGDDAAVAGGLVAWDAGTPFFCGDAIADPLAGLIAAAAGLEALATTSGVIVDVSMAAVAAQFAGATCPAGPHPAVPPKLSALP